MLEEIQKSISEIQQARSNFQLKKFIISQHPTAEMQFYQTCIELQDLIYKYRHAELNIKKQNIKVLQLEKSNNETDRIEAEEIKLGIEQTLLAMKGTEREISCLIEIYNSFEKKFTRQEIEDAQFDYWKARLTGNAKAMLMGGVSVNPAHIEAMEQAGVLEEFVKEVEASKKELSV